MKLSRILFIITITVLLASSAMAALTNNKYDDSKNKYSLKHLNKLSNSYLSFQARFRSAQPSNFLYTREANGVSMTTPVNTYLYSQKTTTTFVYPYKYTAKVPKFKAPVKPQQ